VHAWSYLNLPHFPARLKSFENLVAVHFFVPQPFVWRRLFFNRPKSRRPGAIPGAYPIA
jgi:hypothetical protein